MKCKQCGTELTEGVNICPSCGLAIEEKQTTVLKLDNVESVVKPIPVETANVIPNEEVKPVEIKQPVEANLPVQPIPVEKVEVQSEGNAMNTFPGAFTPNNKLDNAIVDEPIIPALAPVAQPVQPQVQQPVQPSVQPVKQEEVKVKSNKGLTIITVILGIIAFIVLVLVVMNFINPIK